MNPRSVFARALAIAAVGVSVLLSPTAKAQANPQLLPYMTSLVAGGGSSSTFTVGQACPSSGYTATDTVGDGCLATEVVLQKPRFVTSDTAGNIYFDEYTTNRVRRIDATTGIVTTIAGGATGTGTTVNANCVGSTNSEGDGCVATAVFMYPSGLAVSPLTGDLYIGDTYNFTVRKLNLTTGIISLAAGTPRTSGFYIWDGSNYVAGASARLYYPYGLHFDASGNLAIAEETRQAILVLNTASASHAVGGVTIPSGAIAKVVGYYNNTNTQVTSVYCNAANSPTTTTGCSYGTWADGDPGNSSSIDNPYGIAMDASGNIYWANEFNNTVGKVDTTGKVYSWLGKQASSSSMTNTRAVGNTIYIGSNFGVSVDSDGNVYTADSLKGWVWRVDAATQVAYVVAGAGTSCNSSTYGDGCPASQTKFTAGTSSNGAYVTNATTAPGLYGNYTDANNSLYVVDFAAGMIHKIANNTDFGTIYPTNPSQTIDIHFGANDVAASSNPYVITTNPQNFTVGTATCTTNTDNTQDCLLSITATPTQEGAFTGVLTVTSAAGKVGTFTLKGVLKTSRAASTTGLAVSSATTNPAQSITLTATVSPANGASGGTVNFYDGSALIGSSTANSSGIAILSYAFPLGTHSVTASFAENLFLYASTSPAVTVVSLTPAVGVSLGNTSLTVTQGQYGLTNLALSSVGLYSGTVTFGCTGLPANASCVFNPSSVTVDTSTSPTVALTIKTQSTTSALVTMPGALNKGIAFALLPGFALLFFGLRRKRTRLPSMMLLAVLSVMATMGLTGCGSGVTPLSPTPTGTYTVTVTATGTPSVLSGTTNVTTVATLTLKVTN